MKSRIFLLLALFLMSALRADANQEFFPFLASLTADQVNIRAGGNTNYEVLSKLSKTDEVVVMGEEYGWYRIRLPKKITLYISEDYVLNGMITGSKVNIRARPSVHSTVMAKAMEGDYVSVREYGVQPGWAAILPTEESYGWVAKEFLAFRSKDVSHVSEAVVFVEEEPIEPTVVSESYAAFEETEEPALQTFQGVLEPVRLSDHTDIQYQVVVSSGEKYYIKGYNRMLDVFENFTVAVEGYFEDESAAILKAKSVQLVL